MRLRSLFWSGAFAFTITLSGQNDSLPDRLQRLGEAVVTAKNAPQQFDLHSSQMGGVVLNGENLLKTPALFGEVDVLKVLQLQSGIHTGVEGFSGLYVRGGENDQNLFLLHHLPLYGVSHLGGMFSTFHAATIKKINFYKAGFPARFGGRVSGITDIRLCESDYDAYHGQASLGLLTGSAFLTGPIVRNKVAFGIGLRRSWMDLITAPALAIYNASKKKEGKKSIGRYAFGDLNVKVDYHLTERLRGYTHLYFGNDRMKVGEEKFSTVATEHYLTSNVVKLDWGNRGVVSGLDWNLGAHTLLNVNLYQTHYKSRFLQNQQTETREDGTNANEYVHKTNENSVEDRGLSLTADFLSEKWYALKAGLTAVHHIYKPEQLSIESNKEGFSATQLYPKQKVGANEFALFAENTVDFSKRLQGHFGLRFVLFVAEGKNKACFEPRAAMRFLVNDHISLKASYTRMHQFVQQVSTNYISLPTDSWYPTTSQWLPLRSDQWAVGVYGNLPKEFFLGIEAYYKRLQNLLSYREGSDVFSGGKAWSDKLTAGRGYAYGIDLNLHKTIGCFTGGLGYSLLWNYRNFASLNNGRTFPSKYDNRHKLNVNCQFLLKKSVELYAVWTYMTGNRMTLALQNFHSLSGAGFDDSLAPTSEVASEWGWDFYETRNNICLPAYHRLDLGVNFTRRLKKGREGIWNISLYNVYSRMNAITISKEGNELSDGRGGDWSTKFQTVSLFPFLPSVSYTIKF